jgi:two-component system nitrogen regulation sensor histidine kinase GlnL
MRDLGHVLDALLDGVIVLDPHGRVERLNAEACRILEGSAETLAGQPVERLLGAGHGVARLARAALASGSSASESAQPVERRHERPLVVDVAVAPLLDDEAGVLDGAVVVLHDRTLQHGLQVQAAERERLDAFGRIAAGLAHEIKNPLGGIRGAAELIALRARDEKTRETAELVIREARRIATLVDDFTVLAETDALRLESTNVHLVLDQVLDLLAMDPLGARTRVERRYDPSIPEFLADPDRLTQVFLNLGRNALQAMAGGGTLVITSRLLLEARVAAPAQRRVPSVAIEFRDTGAGMPRSVLEQVCTPFFTTRPGGTGLGLSVAEYWVARHGGSLALESAVGEGTCVRVALPLRRQP